MQRFKQPNMDLHPDGEWIRYDDHVEAMKRIAGTSPAALTDEQIFAAQEQAGLPNHPHGGSQEVLHFARLIERCVIAASPANPAPAALTDVRADGFRDCIDAIKGAILFGRQETNPPPEGHWLTEFWQIGRKLAASPADQVEDARNLLTAASHALRSYQYGNAAPDLAESIADRIDAAMSASKEGA